MSTLSLRCQKRCLKYLRSMTMKTNITRFSTAHLVYKRVAPFSSQYIWTIGNHLRFTDASMRHFGKGTTAKASIKTCCHACSTKVCSRVAVKWPANRWLFYQALSVLLSDLQASSRPPSIWATIKHPADHWTTYQLSSILPSSERSTTAQYVWSRERNWPLSPQGDKGLQGR